MPITQERAEEVASRFDLGDAVVLGDPDLVFYRALGAGRPSASWTLRPDMLWTGLRELLRGHVPRREVASDDVLILGVDVVADADGRILLCHRAANAGDRLDPAMMIAALPVLTTP
jgi:hypothetical protein